MSSVGIGVKTKGQSQYMEVDTKFYNLPFKGLYLLNIENLTYYKTHNNNKMK